jgi:hypothetical protein
MRRHMIFACAVIMLFGCISERTKRFTLVVEPPDADIRVVSGSDLKELQYRSPAEITAVLPNDTVLEKKAMLEITRAKYKPVVLALRNIKDGDNLSIKLEKAVQYRLKCRLLSPVPSDEIKFQDKVVSVLLIVEDRQFHLTVVNLTSSELKILWDGAAYTDVKNRQHRLMHSGIRYQDRNSSLPSQPVPPHGSVQEAVMPTSSVVYSPQTKTYENLPLFPLDSESAAGLKGKIFYLYIPVRIDRQIFPYNFKIEIADVIKEE